MKIIFKILVMVFLLTILFYSDVNSKIIYVPVDSATIQGGINGAVDGDTVSVAPGTYHETLYIFDKNITVYSDSGASVTIIDANYLSHVIKFGINLTAETIIDGFLQAGEHKYQWDGSHAASGVYFYRLQARNFFQTKKMLLLK